MAFPSTVSASGRAFIERMEGRRKNAYRDEGGRWTIGVGHTGADVHAGLLWTDEQINAALDDDLARIMRGVKLALKREPTQGQFDAMVSLTFNIGVGAFAKSTVAKAFNAGDDIAAANAFMMWRKVTKGGKKVDSPILIKRRALEKAMFLEATEVQAVAAAKKISVTAAPQADKMTESGTVKGATLATSAGILSGVMAIINQGQDFLMQQPWIGPFAQFVVAQYPKLAGALAVLIVGGGAWLIWHRVQTRRNGLL